MRTLPLMRLGDRDPYTPNMAECVEEVKEKEEELVRDGSVEKKS